MLVLSRKVGQRIQIGRNVTLTVVSLRGGRVRVGIDAPDEVRVLRGELGTEWLEEASDALPEPALVE